MLSVKKASATFAESLTLTKNRDMKKHIIRDRSRDITLLIDVNECGAISGINYCKDVEIDSLSEFMEMDEPLSIWVISRLFAMDLIKYSGSEKQLDCICAAISDQFLYFEIPGLTSFDSKTEIIETEIPMQKPINIASAFASALSNAGFSGYGNK